MNKLVLAFFMMAVLCVEGIEHRFLCVDNGGNRLIYVDQKREGRNWSVALPKGSRDLQLIGDDVVLVSHGNGAGEYSLKDGRLLKLISDSHKNINSVRRLKSGETMFVSRSGEISILDNSGKEINSFEIKEKSLDIRLVRFSAAGNLMAVQTKSPRSLVEADMTGKILHRTPLPDKGYQAHELKNGNKLVSVGDSVKVIEVDDKGRVLRFVGGREKHAEAGMDFFSGFDVLANGNVVVANWLGHGKHGTAPHLFEFDKENNIVWSWEDHGAAKQVTNLLILE